jgi:hypothetical protein
MVEVYGGRLLKPFFRPDQHFTGSATDGRSYRSDHHRMQKRNYFLP